MPEPEEKKPGEEESALATELVKHLAISLRNVKGYPPGHPFVQKTLRETFGLVRDALGGMDELAVCIFESQVMVEDIRVDSTTLPAAIGFLDALRKVDVRSLNFYQALKMEELESLFSILAMDKLSVKDGGGVDGLLREKGVQGIRVNQVEFGIISKRERSKGVDKVVLSLEAFDRLLASPRELLKQASDAPADLAALLVGAGGEELRDTDRVVMNVAKVASALSHLYGEDERAEYAAKLVQFVEQIQSDLKKRSGEDREFDQKLAKVIRKALEDLSDRQLVSTILTRFEEVRGLPGPELKGEMRSFIEGLHLEPERKSSLYPGVKESLMAEGVAEDDILAILASEDEKTLEMLLRDPVLLMRELSTNPGSVADLMAGPGRGGQGDLDRILDNVAKAVAALSRLYGPTRKAEYAKDLAAFVGGVGPALREKVSDKQQFDDRMTGIVTKAFGTLSDDDLVDTVVAKVGESGDLSKEELETDLRRLFRGFLLDKEKKASFQSLLRHRLSEMRVPGEALISLVAHEELKDFLPEEGTAPLREAVVLDRGTLDGLKEKIRRSMEIKDLEILLKPVLKTLEDRSPEVRRRGVDSLGEMLEGLLEAREPRVAEKLVDILREQMDREECFEVYLSYVSILERIARRMRATGREDIAEEIQAVFTQHISEEGKKKRAVEALGKVGGRDALISLLSALWESGIYKEVRDAIVKMGKEAMPLVIEIFREAEDRLLRRRIIDLLVNVGEDAIEPVKETLSDQRWHVRKDGAAVLSRISLPRALGPLASLLSDRELAVRKEAADGMGAIGGEQAEAYLLSALEKGDMRLRPDLLRILGKMGGERSVSSLVALLMKEGRPDEEKVQVLRALGQIGSKSAVEALRKVIEERVLTGRPKYSDEVRVGAVYALGKTAGAEVREFLEELSREEKSRSVQVAAASAIKRLARES